MGEPKATILAERCKQSLGAPATSSLANEINKYGQQAKLSQKQGNTLSHSGASLLRVIKFKAS
jgi:hypothetical protein